MQAIDDKYWILNVICVLLLHIGNYLLYIILYKWSWLNPFRKEDIFMTVFEFSILFIYFLTSEARMLPLEGGKRSKFDIRDDCRGIH